MIHAEYNESVRLAQWLRWRDIKFTHVANETGGNFKMGAMNKSMGVSPGFPDYLIFLPNGVNVAIELKEPSGKNKASKLQVQWLKTLSAHGFQVAVSFGALDAIKFLTESCGYIDDRQPNLKETWYSNANSTF